MADTTSQLQRIADLVERASGISRKQRGMRIEADEWNTLVDVLLGILQVDRLQEMSQDTQLELRFALRDHDHLGQVSVAWLDPDLQSRLSGPGGVSTREVLAGMDRRIQALTDTVTAMQAIVNDHQQNLDRSAVDEIDRSQSLRNFQTKFDGVANLSTLVGTLSSDVGSLTTNVGQVLEMKKVLTDPQGNTIDIAKVQSDVAGLQTLRDSLKGVDGNLLTMKDLEIRLTDVANAAGVGTQGSLDKRLADLSAQIETEVGTNTNKLLADGLAGIKSDNQSLEARLQNQIQDSATKTQSAAAAETTRQVGVLQQSQDAALKDAVSAATASITASTLDSTSALLDQRLKDVPDIAKSAAVAAVANMGKQISTDLQASFDAQIATQIQVSNTVIDARLRPLETGLPALRDSIPGLISHGVQDSTAALQASINQQISSGITVAQQQLQEQITTQVNSSIASNFTNINTHVITAIHAQMPAVNASINKDVVAATKNLNEDIKAEVGRQVASANLDSKIQKAVRTSHQQLQANLASQLAGQESRLTSLVSTNVGTLRGEIKSSADSSVARSHHDVISAPHAAGIVRKRKNPGTARP